MEKRKLKKDWWKEFPDPTPMEIPIDLKRPETMDEKMRRIISTEISAKAQEAGAESWEDAHDFDVKDDFEVEEPISKYEYVEMEAEFPESASPIIPEEGSEKDDKSDSEPKADSGVVESKSDSMAPEPHQTEGLEEK